MFIFLLEKRHFFAAIFAFVFLFASHTPGQAVTVNVNGSNLVTSITNLSVGLNTYDIDFIDGGSYNSAFVGGETFSDGDDIASAIGAALNALPSIPSGIEGSTTNTFYLIPLSFNVSGDVYIEAWLSEPPWAFAGNAGISTDAPIGANQAWAKPSLVAPVPLPAAFPLFAGGLGLLSLLGWRRKRMATT